MDVMHRAVLQPWNAAKRIALARRDQVVTFVWTLIKYLVLAFVVFHLVLGCAIVLYALFYYVYVPVPLHSFDVYLDYSGPRPATHFPLAPRARALLQARQEYDVKLWLLFPESDANINAGVFMVDLLLTSSQQAAARLAQPIANVPATPVCLCACVCVCVCVCVSEG
jgi:hypothetical protein